VAEVTPDGRPAGEGAFPDDQRAAVYRVIEERRDVRRGFLPDPVPADVLERVLAAGHRAPSVGFSQPWDFIVISDRQKRARIKDLAERGRDDFAASLP
jgi:nicotinate-nucleotide--dimethylbenzimidazole phosphoribosyltransferase